MLTYISLLFLFFYGVLATWRIDWALGFLIFSLPLYVVRFSFFGLPLTLLEGMILICFGVWLIKNGRKMSQRIKARLIFWKQSERDLASPNFRYPFDVEIILVLFVSFLAMAVSDFSNPAMGIWKAYFFEPLLVYILVFNVFFAPSQEEKADIDYLHRSWAKIILPLSFSALLISLFAIYQKISGDFIPNPLWAAAGTRRVTSLFAYPNAVGLYLGPIIVLMSGFLLSIAAKHSQRFCGREACETWSPFSFSWFFDLPFFEKAIIGLLKISTVFSLLAIYFAKSDGALIAVVLAVGLMAFFYEPLTRIGIIRFILAFIIGISIISALILPSLRQRAWEYLRLEDFSGQVRKAQWQETGIMLRDGNWLWGAGLSGYSTAIEPYHAPGIYLHTDNPDHEELIVSSPEYQARYWQPLEIFMYPHNIFLNFWVELGLMGFLVFLWIIFKALYQSFLGLFGEKDPARRSLAITLLATIFVILIHGIVDVPYFKNDLSVLFWLIIALVGLLRLSSNRKGRTGKQEV